MIVGSSQIENVRVEADDEETATLIGSSLQTEVARFGRREHRLWRPLAHSFRALGSLLRYIVHTRALPKSYPSFPDNSSNSVAFFDYLSGSIQKIDGTSTYVSPHWGEVPGLVHGRSWYHVYPRNIDNQGLRNSLGFIQELNGLGTGDHHLFLKRIKVSDVINIVRQMVRQRRIHKKFQGQLRTFSSAGSRLHLWHVFEDEWDDSILGSTGIRHLLLLASADSFVSAMPAYRKIYYLMENQPWEIILCHLVKKYNKGAPIGVAHSTIRFWDLRYFADPRENPVAHPDVHRPSPAKVFVNGELARALLQENGFPSSSIFLVEASRYNYLHQAKQNARRAYGDIVLLGDFDERANTTLLSTFRDALLLNPINRRIRIRSHPICPLTGTQLGPLTGCVTEEPLLSLLQSAAIVITTSGSSGSAESVALGISTIIVLDPKSLNYSPLRGTGTTTDVRNANELAVFLRNPDAYKQRNPMSIFSVDSQYPRWNSEFASK